MKVLSVVVPVYYNAGSIQVLFEELCAVEQLLLARDVLLQLIFVDDGSGDTSWHELLKVKAARPSTVLVRLSRNFGAVHASKAGLQFVSGDCFLILAADLQDPPALAVQGVEYWLNGSKFVLFARAERSDPLVATIFSRAYYRLLKLLVVPDYPNGGYDLALMDKIFLPHLVNSSKNVNTPLFAYWLGFTPTIISYSRRERTHGRSRWTFSKRVKFLIDSLLGFSVTPIRAISAIGIAVSSLSILYGTTIVVNAVRGKSSVAGFPTLAALIAFLFGIVIIMLGIIGEYIWRIFDEVNRRPESVIEEVC